MQLERKGFYRIDKAYSGDDHEGLPVLFYIPDGRKEKSLAEKLGIAPPTKVAPANKSGKK